MFHHHNEHARTYAGLCWVCYQSTVWPLIKPLMCSQTSRMLLISPPNVNIENKLIDSQTIHRQGEKTKQETGKDIGNGN